VACPSRSSNQAPPNIKLFQVLFFSGLSRIARSQQLFGIHTAIHCRSPIFLGVFQWFSFSQGGPVTRASFPQVTASPVAPLVIPWHAIATFRQARLCIFRWAQYEVSLLNSPMMVWLSFRCVRLSQAGQYSHQTPIPSP